MRDMTDAERKLVKAGKCPACLSTGGWLEGPSGGMCQNLECERCGLRINVDPIMLVAQIIGMPDIERCEREGVQLYDPEIPAAAISDGPADAPRRRSLRERVGDAIAGRR